MKTYLSILITALFIVNSHAQDVIYTITGLYQGKQVSVDSISVENLSNYTRIGFGPLAAQDNYQIRLQRQMETTVEPTVKDSIGFYMVTHSPGFIQLNYNGGKASEVNIEVYNASGQVLYSAPRDYIYPGAMIDVRLGNPGIYFVKVSSEGKSELFKAMGSPAGSGAVEVQILAGQRPQGALKGTDPITGFAFETGDSLRISVFKEGYFAWPQYVKIVDSESLDYTLELSRVDVDGISDAYVAIDEDNSEVHSYDDLTGRLVMGFSETEPDLNPGSIITVNLDTVYVLRKVMKVYNSADSTIMETDPAYLNEVFIDKAFKIHTGYMEPNSQLKSTSSLEAISDALTDEDGYIHPYEVTFTDAEGRTFKKSVRNMPAKKSADNDGFRDTLLRYKEPLNETIFQSKNEVVNFYSHDSKLELSLDFCGEFEFDPDLGEITEETKIERGDIVKYDYWLQGRADLVYLLTLTMSEEYKAGPRKPALLLPLGKYRVTFVVGVVPVSITFVNNLYYNYSVNASAYMEANWGFEYHHELKLGASYDKEKDDIALIKESKPELIFHPLEIKGEVHADARAEIFPRIEVLLYNFIGPYFDITPFLDGEFNLKGNYSTFKTDPQDPPNAFVAWDSRFGIGLDFRVGAKLKGFLGFKKEFGPTVFHLLNDESDDQPSKAIYQAPYYMERLRLVPEEIEMGQSITLKFKVTNQSVFPKIDNKPVPFCPVYLEGDGTFSKHIAFTDLNGEIEVLWTPTEEGSNSCTATVYKASEEVVSRQHQSVFIPGNYAVNKGVFTDSRDGQSYDWVRIGDQVWMAENLRYIPNVGEYGLVPGSVPNVETADPYWESYTHPYCYVYGYNGVNEATARSYASYNNYGVLYNYKAATESCPSGQGWYLPTDGDWDALEEFMAGKYGFTQSPDGYYWNDMGKALKSSSWNGTDAVGFKATAGGMRDREDGSFINQGNAGYWWSTGKYTDDCHYYRYLHWSDDFYRGHLFNQYGVSVRCIKK